MPIGIEEGGRSSSAHLKACGSVGPGVLAYLVAIAERCIRQGEIIDIPVRVQLIPRGIWISMVEQIVTLRLVGLASQASGPLDILVAVP